MKREKTYILKHTPDGLTLVRDRDFDAMVVEDGADVAPPLSELRTPRWTHWYQRKLARAWQATLLGMNIEPAKSARQILKAHDGRRFNTYIDRLDIVQTLMGVDIGVYENHVREGEAANEKYIELAEYCRYAESLGWADMKAMREGLRLNDDPPTLQMSVRQQNSVLLVLDSVLRCVVKDYRNGQGERSPAAVLKWWKDNNEKPPVSDSTLRNWFNELASLDERKRSQTQG